MLVKATWLFTFYILSSFKNCLVASGFDELSNTETALEWIQVGGNITSETNSYQEDGAQFSVQISGDGSTVAVGAPHANDGLGQVVVSRYDSFEQTWIRMGSAITEDSGLTAFAGRSVSLSEDGMILAVGFPGAIDLMTSCCVESFARVYKWNQQLDDWEQLGSNIFDDKYFWYDEDHPDHEPDRFYLSRAGWSVSLSHDGRTLAVGAPTLNNPPSSQTRVYHYDDEFTSDWVQLGDSISDEWREGAFSVNLSGDASTLAIGCPGCSNQNSGKVTVFRWDNLTQNWAQFGNKIFGDNPGYSVSLSLDGNVIAIGHSSSLVRIYRMNQTNSTWGQVGSDILPEDGPGWNDYGHGKAVSLSGNGDMVALAAPSMSINDVIYGLAQVYQINPTTAAWDMVDKEIPGEDDYFNDDYTLNVVSLSSNGTRLVVGTPLHVVCPVFDFSCPIRQRYENWTGHVRAYDLITTASPTTLPSTVPSLSPTALPSTVPSLLPTALPSTVPSLLPTALPNAAPTNKPTALQSAATSALLLPDSSGGDNNKSEGKAILLETGVVVILRMLSCVVLATTWLLFG